MTLNTKLHFSSATGKWNTPPWLTAEISVCLDGIDCDPCSDSEYSVPAKNHHTEWDNGLLFDWNGKIYMNPPYGRGIGDWVRKLVCEYQAGRTTEAIALVPARPDTAWFGLLWANTSCICFLRGRLKFGNAENSAPFPSALAYFGSDTRRFSDQFKTYGWAVIALGKGT